LKARGARRPEDPGAGRDPRAPFNLRELARGAVWLVGIAAAVQLIDFFIGQSPLAAAVVGVVVVELATSRGGLLWSRPASAAIPAPVPSEDPPGSRRSPVAQPDKEDADRGRRALRSLGLGAAVGLVAAALAVVVAILSGSARIEAGSPSGALVWALIRVAALAPRDELLLRGWILHTAERAGLSPRMGVAFAALAGGASIALLPGAEPASIALAVAAGWIAATLWNRAGTAWAAIGVHAGWALFSGVGIRGGLVDVTFASGSLGEGIKASGAPAWIAAVVFSAMALAAGRLAKRSGTPRAA
jgi:membrane protease YdiL (CAAX protease family)